MRYFKIFLLFLIPVALIFILDTGIAGLPPLGKLMDPVRGFMANAETEQAFSDVEVPVIKPNVGGSVYFDERLVPHIFAEDDQSLYFMQGYVTAKYRLWQMDIQSRAAGGRLSEIFGDRFVAYDLEQRRMGMVYAAERNVELWKADSALFGCLTSYADGVNAYIDEILNDGYEELPIEFKLLNYKPEPWTVLNSALLLQYMSSTLTGYDDDMEYSNLRKLLSKEDFELLFPDRPAGIDPIIPKEKTYDFAAVSNDTLQQAIRGGYFRKVLEIFETEHGRNQVGSNNWAIDSSKSKSGKPILANDPHLQLNLPSLWFEIQLQTPNSNCYGVSLPGAPAIVIGYNEHIAWGVTNAGLDVRDWYTVEFQDDTETNYKFGKKWLPTEKRVETIVVRDGDPVIDTVLYTQFGPIVYNDEMINREPDATPFKKQRVHLAMRWAALEPGEPIKTFYLLNRATDFNDYRHAISYFNCPAQNFVFAAQDGDIAITQQGRLPLKKQDQGRFILDGSNPDDYYTGFIPYDHNPYILNPERGFVSSANQHGTDETYPDYYTGFDFEFYRNRIINRSLEKTQDATIETMQQLQQNNFNLHANEALPVMFGHLSEPCKKGTGSSACEVYTALQEWKFMNDPDIEAPTYFQVWWDTLYQMLWDEMRDSVIAYVQPNIYNTVNAMQVWPVDYALYDVKATTDQKETLDDLIEMSFSAMVRIVDSLRKEDKSLLTWYKHKNTQIMHLSQIPAFSKTGVHTGGYRNIVNATSERNGPSWRMIVELTEPVQAVGVYPGGQSGNPGSKYYDNFIDSWATGKYYILHMYSNEEEAAKDAKFSIRFN